MKTQHQLNILKKQLLDRFVQIEKIFVLIGSPLSGKSYTAKLLQTHKFPKSQIISIGNLLKYHKFQKTLFGEFVAELISNGKMLNNILNLMLLSENLYQYTKVLIFDGFPRTAKQFEFYSF